MKIRDTFLALTCHESKQRSRNFARFLNCTVTTGYLHHQLSTTTSSTSLGIKFSEVKKKTGIAKWHSSQSQNIAFVLFSTFSGFIILQTGTRNPRQASCSVVLAMAKATFQAANFFGDECHGKSSGKQRLETHPRRFWWFWCASI